MKDSGCGDKAVREVSEIRCKNSTVLYDSESASKERRRAYTGSHANSMQLFS